MITAIIQARTGSTRLPEKVLKELAGQAMIGHVIQRVMAAKRIEQVVLATTDQTGDDPLAELARSMEIIVFRGSQDDVLDRYYQAAVASNASVIVRITGDCPVIDPHIIDQTVGLFLSDDYDYVSNFLTRHYPDGLDTEVFSFETLQRAWQDAQLKSEREHVTPYIYKHPEHFRQVGLTYPLDLSQYRWTVDEPVDFDFIQAIYGDLYESDPLFGMDAILALLQRRPELLKINQGIGVNEGYEKSLREDAAMLIGALLEDVRYPAYAVSNSLDVLLAEVPESFKQRVINAKAYADNLITFLVRWDSEHHEGMNVSTVVDKRAEYPLITRTEWDIFLHDAANPLTSIRGYAKLLLQMANGKVPSTPEQQEKFLRTIVENEMRLHMLVDNMRRLLGLERGTSPIRRERVNVEDVLSSVTDTLNLRLQDEDRHVNVILQVDGETPDVLADREKLYEAIRRLVDNALNFTEDGGIINLSAYRNPSTNVVVIHIEDTGVGISQEIAHRIFERFFRGDHEIAMRIPGNGLGLSVAQAYIEAQNGTIGFESTLGKGTIFHIILPMYIDDSN